MEPAATQWNERQRRRARKWRIALALAGAVLAALLFVSHQTTERIELGGHAYEVVTYQVHTSYQYGIPDGARTQRFLWLQYYTEQKDAAGRKAEALQIAPELYPVAEQRGVSAILLQPSTALFTRTFPLLTMSWQFAFGRDSAGQWHAATPVGGGV